MLAGVCGVNTGDVSEDGDGLAVLTFEKGLSLIFVVKLGDPKVITVIQPNHLERFHCDYYTISILVVKGFQNFLRFLFIILLTSKIRLTLDLSNLFGEILVANTVMKLELPGPIIGMLNVHVRTLRGMSRSTWNPDAGLQT